MCGISGIVGPQATAELAERMSARLLHRGPDDGGTWSQPGVALAHRRLAILDLSAAGHQPMTHGAFTITYNGEIYNYQSLRDSLPGPFRSNTDTEVLLHLLAERGDAALDALNGMFAFAAWDAGRRRLLAARDRLGIKPLYYRPLPGGVAFASELKALLELGRPEIDRTAVRDFLLHGYVPAPKTIYRGIAKLPAAHALSWEDGRLETWRWWQPSADVRHADAAEAARRLEELLSVIVPEHALADVPVGVFLSGGIDSAAVASFLGRPRTFTLGFTDRDRSELDPARRLAEHLGTEHREMMTGEADLARALDTLVPVFDEPFGDSAAWSVWLISKLARERVTVALTGEGGDEAFCGYPRYWTAIGGRSTPANRWLARNLPPLTRLGQSMQRRAFTGLEANAAALGAMTPPQVRALLHPDWLEDAYDDLWFFRQHWRPELPAVQRLRWLDLNTNLAEGLLTKVDRASMAHSLEVRPPLLDHRLVEFALGVDPALLVDRAAGKGKLLLRALLEPRLPPGHLDRPKSGFGLPVHRWIRRNATLFERAVTRLVDAGVLRRRVSPEFRKAWSLLVLDRWLHAEA